MKQPARITVRCPTCGHMFGRFLMSKQKQLALLAVEIRNALGPYYPPLNVGLAKLIAAHLWNCGWRKKQK